VGSCIVTAILCVKNPIELYWIATINKYFNMGCVTFRSLCIILLCEKSYSAIWCCRNKNEEHLRYSCLQSFLVYTTNFDSELWTVVVRRVYIIVSTLRVLEEVTLFEPSVAHSWQLLIATEVPMCFLCKKCINWKQWLDNISVRRRQSTSNGLPAWGLDWELKTHRKIEAWYEMLLCVLEWQALVNT
jgi:hypothetical protein